MPHRNAALNSTTVTVKLEDVEIDNIVIALGPHSEEHAELIRYLENRRASARRYRRTDKEET